MSVDPTGALILAWHLVTWINGNLCTPQNSANQIIKDFGQDIADLRSSVDEVHQAAPAGLGRIQDDWYRNGLVPESPAAILLGRLTKAYENFEQTIEECNEFFKDNDVFQSDLSGVIRNILWHARKDAKLKRLKNNLQDQYQKVERIRRDIDSRQLSIPVQHVENATHLERERARLEMSGRLSGETILNIRLEEAILELHPSGTRGSVSDFSVEELLDWTMIQIQSYSPPTDNSRSSHRGAFLTLIKAQWLLGQVALRNPDEITSAASYSLDPVAAIQSRISKLYLETQFVEVTDRRLMVLDQYEFAIKTNTSTLQASSTQSADPTQAAFEEEKILEFQIRAPSDVETKLFVFRLKDGPSEKQRKSTQVRLYKQSTNKRTRAMEPHPKEIVLNIDKAWQHAPHLLNYDANTPAKIEVKKYREFDKEPEASMSLEFESEADAYKFQWTLTTYDLVSILPYVSWYLDSPKKQGHENTIQILRYEPNPRFLEDCINGSSNDLQSPSDRRSSIFSYASTANSTTRTFRDDSSQRKTKKQGKRTGSQAVVEGTISEITHPPLIVFTGQLNTNTYHSVIEIDQNMYYYIDCDCRKGEADCSCLKAVIKRTSGSIRFYSTKEASRVNDHREQHAAPNLNIFAKPYRINVEAINVACATSLASPEFRKTHFLDITKSTYLVLDFPSVAYRNVFLLNFKVVLDETRAVLQESQEVERKHRHRSLARHPGSSAASQRGRTDSFQSIVSNSTVTIAASSPNLETPAFTRQPSRMSQGSMPPGSRSPQQRPLPHRESNHNYPPSVRSGASGESNLIPDTRMYSESTTTRTQSTQSQSSQARPNSGSRFSWIRGRFNNP